MAAVEATTDVLFVSSVINHPEVVKHLTDGDPLPIPMHESIYYLRAKTQRYADGAVEDVPIGVLAFVPVNKITWNPHIAILPEFQGLGLGTDAMRAGVRWMFENTPCRKVVAYPPAFNKAMIRVFKKCGFRVEGRSPDSFLWRGELHDRLLMGIERD